MNRDAFVAHDIPDLLDLLPALFGFAPRQSFVAIVTHGDRRRFGFRLRLDIPELHQAVPAAIHIVDLLHRQKADGVILLALTERVEVADSLMAGVMANLSGLPVHEAARCDGNTYWLYDSLGPGKAMPYASRCSPVVVGAIVAGMQILPDREALVSRFAPVSGPRKSAMESATSDALIGAVREMSIRPEADLRAAGMMRLLPIIDHHATGRSLSDEERAMLAIWVSSVGVRDAVWSQMRRDNAELALALWTDISQTVVEPFEAPVLCLAGFAAWLCGDGAQSLIAVERALTVDSSYSMARLVMDMLEAGVPPDSWEGFEPQPPAIAA